MLMLTITLALTLTFMLEHMLKLTVTLRSHALALTLTLTLALTLCRLHGSHISMSTIFVCNVPIALTSAVASNVSCNLGRSFILF